jgi:hypothetical protein
MEASAFRVSLSLLDFAFMFVSLSLKIKILNNDEEDIKADYPNRLRNNAGRCRKSDFQGK